MSASWADLRAASTRCRQQGQWRVRYRLTVSWIELRWVVLGLLGVLGLSLGFTGWITVLHAHTFGGFADAGYRTLALLRLSGPVAGPIPWTLDLARFLLPLVAGWSAIAALRRVYRDRIQLLTLPAKHGQVIVVGLGDKGLSFVQSFRHLRDTVVVIEINPFAAGLKAARKLGAVVVIGDGQDVEVLTSAGVIRAKMLLAVTGEDGINAEILLQSRRISDGSQAPQPQCYAHVSDWHLAELLGLDQIRQASGEQGIFEFFSTAELSARAIIEQFWLPIEHSQRSPLVLVGFSSLSQRALTEAAARNVGLDGGPLDCIVIDRSGRESWNALILRHPALAGQVVPAFFDDIGGAVTDLAELPAGVHPLVIVDLQQDGRSISEAILLSEMQSGRPATIVVALRRSSGLGTAINRDRGHALYDIQAFPVIERTCTEQIIHTALVERIARDIHESYVQDQSAKGVVNTEPAMAPWGSLAEEFKSSNRAQAKALGAKLHAIGASMTPQLGGRAPAFRFTPGEIEQLAELEHQRWCAERTRAGWIHTDGPRDLATKRSPYLVAWSELTEQVKELDRNTVRTIPAQCARAHAVIRRVVGDATGVTGSTVSFARGRHDRDRL